MPTIAWEYLVLQVSASIADGKWSYLVRGWVDRDEIYNETIDDMYWSDPLARFGSEGWELVTSIQNMSLFSGHSGFVGPVSEPIATNFILKRPAPPAP